MKNVHLISTDKPSRLYYNTELPNNFIHNANDFPLHFDLINDKFESLNIYITNSEEIQVGDYYYNERLHQIFQAIAKSGYNTVDKEFKVALTTDQDLIKDGVQVIDDEFLEWFVKNPSCESVEVKEFEPIYGHQNNSNSVLYKIIIPSVEPKQETLEEVVNNFKKTDVYINEIKQEQERSYSEEEVIKILLTFRAENPRYINLWFEQFKKK
jgi:GR25 family glycosyltransferase involved in LPS biosynthesis